MATARYRVVAIYIDDFSYRLSISPVIDIDRYGKKYYLCDIDINVAKMLPKSGFGEKEKSPKSLLYSI